MKDIAAWQREFYAAPAVWAVFDRDGCLSDLYESKEAAQLEVARRPRSSIVKYHIHSLDLARRRWGWPGEVQQPRFGGIPIQSCPHVGSTPMLLPPGSYCMDCRGDGHGFALGVAPGYEPGAGLAIDRATGEEQPE